MKRQIAKLAAVGSMAAGMIFAQAQPAQPAQQGRNNAQAQAAHGPKAMMRGAQAHKRMMAALNLTPDQKTMAKAIFGQVRQTSQPVRMEMRQNRKAMIAAVKTDNKAQIEQLSTERGKLMAKLSENRGEAMAKFYQALTPAQRTTADRMQARFQARANQWRSQHRGTRTNG